MDGVKNFLVDTNVTHYYYEIVNSIIISLSACVAGYAGPHCHARIEPPASLPGVRLQPTVD